MTYETNPGKSLTREIDGQVFARIPIRTHLIKPYENITEVVRSYLQDLVCEEDLVIISEKVVAIAQGRVLPVAQIKPSPLAVFLARFVHKSPIGIGVGIPCTMEMAIREVGWFRILLAAIVGACGKLFGIRGLFYRIAGPKVRGIDGPCSYAIPPYNQCVVLIPENPQQVAEDLSLTLGCSVAIVDANDFGVNVLGIASSEPITGLLVRLLRDNPLGQSNEQTPIGIIRRICDLPAET